VREVISDGAGNLKSAVVKRNRQWSLNGLREGEACGAGQRNSIVDRQGKCFANGISLLNAPLSLSSVDSYFSSTNWFSDDVLLLCLHCLYNRRIR
jgi:hypothetical protein